MDVVELHRRAVAEFGARVAHVRDDQWAGPTPCAEWDVRALVNHLVGENRWTAPLLAGRTIAEVGDRFDGDLLGSDARGAWASASEEALAAVGEPGALDRTVHLSHGPAPASEYVTQLFVDHLVHAWDLARATGVSERLDPDLVEACAAWFADQEPFYREAGVIGPVVEVDEGADPQTALLSRFGRTA